jgi:hypothetical protein
MYFEDKILQSVTTFVDSDQDYFYSSAAHTVNDWFGNGQPEDHSLNSVSWCAK